MSEGNKYDEGKVKYQLLPPYALKQVARVLTFGAEKYEENNWQKGIPWTKLMGSLERHYQDFKAGIDMDEESGLYHLAHAAVNALMLLEYYRIRPELDDRYKPYMSQKKIVLDVDDVVADFCSAYKERFKTESQNYWDFSYHVPNNLKNLIESDEGRDWYVNLPVLHRPNFTPHAYVSSRSVPVEWTQEFLEKNGLPCRPVYHVPFNTSKVEVLKEIGAEILIDDKWDNFIDAEKAGITAFLMDAGHNQHYNVGYRRIYDLDINNIIR